MAGVSGNSPPVQPASGAEQAGASYARALFAAAPDPILVTDGTGRLVDANRAAAELLRYSHEELLRLRLADVAPFEPAWTEDGYPRLLLEGAWRGPVTVRTKDGTSFVLEAHALGRMPARCSCRSCGHRRPCRSRRPYRPAIGTGSPFSPI